MNDRCECADHACPHHPGRDCAEKQVHGLYRVDMDGARVWFCEPCTDDALNSGVFTTGEEIEDSADEEPEDAEPTEPEEGDYILSPSGNLGTHTAVVQDGRRLATFGPMGEGEKPRSGSDERALSFVRQHMEKEQFWPNVWLQDDHGGYTLATLD